MGWRFTPWVYVVFKAYAVHPIFNSEFSSRFLDNQLEIDCIYRYILKLHGLENPYLCKTALHL